MTGTDVRLSDISWRIFPSHAVEPGSVCTASQVAAEGGHAEEPKDFVQEAKKQ